MTERLLKGGIWVDLVGGGLQFSAFSHGVANFGVEC